MPQKPKRKRAVTTPAGPPPTIAQLNGWDRGSDFRTATPVPPHPAIPAGLTPLGRPVGPVRPRPAGLRRPVVSLEAYQSALRSGFTPLEIAEWAEENNAILPTGGEASQRAIAWRQFSTGSTRQSGEMPVIPARTRRK